MGQIAIDIKLVNGPRETRGEGQGGGVRCIFFLFKILLGAKSRFGSAIRFNNRLFF